MSETGKLFIYAGLGLVIIGILVIIGAKLNIPFGRLPGDIRINRENFTFYFPLATCLVISIILTLLFSITGRK